MIKSLIEGILPLIGIIGYIAIWYNLYSFFKKKNDELTLKFLMKVGLVAHCIILTFALIEECVEFIIAKAISESIAPLNSKIALLEDQISANVEPLKQKIVLLEAQIKELLKNKVDMGSSIKEPSVPKKTLMENWQTKLRPTNEKVELFEKYFTWKNLVGFCSGMVSIFGAFTVIQKTFSAIDNSSIIEIIKNLIVKKKPSNDNTGDYASDDDNKPSGASSLGLNGTKFDGKSPAELSLGDLGIQPKLNVTLRSEQKETELFETTEDKDIDDFFE
jgi:hypothetical protein